MKNIALLISFTFFSLAMCTAKDKRPESIDISNSCSVEQFNEIVHFILQKGQRQTYGNMYNNNPFYQFGKIEVYLNPKRQFPSKEEEKEPSTYTSILFVDRNARGEKHIFMYSDIRKDDEAKKIYLDSEMYETEETMQQRYKIVETYLQKILREINPDKWYTTSKP